MRRREFLASAGAAGLAASAGCLGFLETERATREPPLPENRPPEPYVPTHVEGMEMVDMRTQGRYRCALAYTYPHRFWTVTGSDTDRVNPQGEDSAHVMVMVWDAETGVVLPGTTPHVELVGPGGEPTSMSPWEMLSQPMGVHYGDNVVLSGEGRYDVTVRVPPLATRHTTTTDYGSDPLEFTFAMTFEQRTLENLSYEDIPSDREGTPGAVSPMDMPAVTSSQVPARESFPGEVSGVERTGGASLLMATRESAGQFAQDSDETYLVASLRTPHNRYALPAASLTATVEREGETVYDDRLTATLDPEMGPHYGAVVPSDASPDSVTVNVETPPQLARHEGYETAFFDFEPISF
jgi:uncharacterized protein involved in high-affinity Fe2+ transport